jgi:hypothetical protein
MQMGAPEMRKLQALRRCSTFRIASCSCAAWAQRSDDIAGQGIADIGATRAALVSQRNDAPGSVIEPQRKPGLALAPAQT